MTTKHQPGVRVSEYLLEECIGAGAFCEVWRARHHVWSNELVAVKLPIEPDYVRYLRREGLVVHGLRHPNIVRVLGTDPYGEVPYLTMELVKGPSLKTVIDEHPKGLPIPTTVIVLRGVLNALVAAHAANVLHRDIKPGNIMLHLDGAPIESLSVDRVKVGDFGLGLGGPDALRSIAQSASMERDGNLVGTLAYMAPELRDGEGKPEPRSDLYSVGVVLFEMLTGDRPAGAELPSSLRPEVPHALEDLLRQIYALEEVFRRLYARLDRRYESAQAALEDLDARLEARPPGAGGRVASSTFTPPPVPRRAMCRSCGGEISADDQFCVHCGSQSKELVRRCAKCGGFPGPDDRYCIFCGARLATAAMG